MSLCDDLISSTSHMLFLDGFDQFTDRFGDFYNINMKRCENLPLSSLNIVKYCYFKAEYPVFKEKENENRQL